MLSLHAEGEDSDEPVPVAVLTQTVQSDAAKTVRRYPARIRAVIRDIPSIETIMLDAGSSMMSGSGENYGSGFVQPKDWS